MFDFLHLNPLGHVVDAVADRTGVCIGSDGRAQANAALLAGKLLGVAALGGEGFPADRAAGLAALALVKHYVIAAVGTIPACHDFRAHVDDVAAGALDFFLGEEACARLGKAPAGGALNYEF